MKLKQYFKSLKKVTFWTFSVFFVLVLVFIFVLFVMTSKSLLGIKLISENTSLIIIISVISLLIVSQGVALLMIKRIYNPLEDITRVINEVAKGNFDVSLESSKYKTEMRILADNINLMISDLRSMEVMRSDFVANVSHEFRAPLSSIQGYVTLMSDPEISKEQWTEYFELLKASTRQLSGLVDNVLKLSRLESQNIVQKDVDFSLDEQLRRAVLMFEEQWSEKELVLDLDLPEVEYHGNEDMTGQIWINLIGNAVKFNKQGGTLGVKLSEDDDAITVDVYDSGEGMTDEVKNHIFEKFYQGDTSRKADGNGLGLALVNTVSKLLGYSITVESEVGKGSKFTVKLPK